MAEGSFGPALDIFASGISGYIWILIILVVLGIVGVVVWWATVYKKKDKQWTHALNVKIELADGTISPFPIVHKMRRWKHKDATTAPLFELEKPLLGSRIFVELEQYFDGTSYEIVLGNDGRIYVPTTTIMLRDKNALQVSVKHAAIDRARQSYSERFEEMNATPKKIDALTLLKYGLIGLVIIVFMVLGLTAIKSWGERASYAAASAEAEVRAWETMDKVMTSVESVVNTQALMIPGLKQTYGNNLQGAIKNAKDQLNQT